MSYNASDTNIETAHKVAAERYAAFGVDVEHAMARLRDVSISLHCWQGDDVGGYESPGGEIGGGLAATGNYPGKARTAPELRRDLSMAYSLIPGRHRLNLHAIYAETGGVKVDRDVLLPEHFAGWASWAKETGHGIDFNPTLFAHPLAATNMTLAHQDPAVRKFWVDHCIACRKIGEYFGRELGTPCVTNIWIPDGMKDVPVDRAAPRQRLNESLDQILKSKIDWRYNLDAIEGKLFGLGAESYTVGSHEFYLGYAVANQALLCLDSGHFHPTETISDKLSAILLFVDEMLLHVSRGVRWDSDHVVLLSDDLQAIAQEIVRGGYLRRVHIGLDYFDASINRVAAWVIGTRNTLKALLMALLEPIELMRKLELDGDFGGRLALLEETKALPFGAVWDAYCLRQGVPVGYAFMDEVRRYEQDVLAQRK